MASSAVADGVGEERAARGNSIMLAAWGGGNVADDLRRGDGLRGIGRRGVSACALLPSGLRLSARSHAPGTMALEIGREAATLIMLLGVAALAVRIAGNAFSRSA